MMVVCHAGTEADVTRVVARAAGGLLVTLTGLGALAALSRVLERRRHGRVAGSVGSAVVRPCHAAWPVAACGGRRGTGGDRHRHADRRGRPWGVTAAFALWGAKALDAAGVDVASWPYWTSPAASAALGRSVVYDVTSVMDVGIVLGALAAAGLAGRFAPQWRVPAYFSGIASGSLHGWVWLVAARAGNGAGSTLRPFFRLDARRQDG
jgi:hypothetical protein